MLSLMFSKMSMLWSKGVARGPLCTSVNFPRVVKLFFMAISNFLDC